MTSLCQVIQDKIAENGLATLASLEQEHFDGCLECQGFLKALSEVDAGLRALPSQEDVHSSVVRATLRRVAEDSAARKRFVRMGFLGVGVLGLGLVLFDNPDPALLFLEGGGGGLIMLAALLAALTAVFKSNFRVAGSLATLSLCFFVVRAHLSTFFNDESISDETPAMQYNDMRLPASPVQSLKSLLFKGDAAKEKFTQIEGEISAATIGDQVVSDFNEELKDSRESVDSRNAPASKSALSRQQNQAGLESNLGKQAMQQAASNEALRKDLEQNLSYYRMKGREHAGKSVRRGVGSNELNDSLGELDLQQSRQDAEVLPSEKIEERSDVQPSTATAPHGLELDKDSRGKKVAKPNPSSVAGGSGKAEAGSTTASSSGWQTPIDLTVRQSPEHAALLGRPIGSLVRIFVGDQLMVSHASILAEPVLSPGGVIRIRLGLPSFSVEFQEALMNGESFRLEPIEAPAAPSPRSELNGFNPGQSSKNAFAAYLRERSTLSGVVYKAATGYWKNTYTPADLTLNRLISGLAEPRQVALLQTLAMPGGLHSLAAPTTKPFDANDHGALGLFLNSDRSYVQGESRVLMQVGLKGAVRHSSGRPPMNIVLLFDGNARVTEASQKLMAEVLYAFDRERKSGDRISLVASGAGGGVLIRPGEYRHGTVAVALQRLFVDRSQVGAFQLSSTRAFESALDIINTNNDSNNVLGSSVIVVLSPGSSAIEPLIPLAEEAAVAGVPVSAISVSSETDMVMLGELTRAGQGNRRIAFSVAECADVVKSELNALSRVVARAIRLRIRLAAGVKLVNVFGSRNLAEPEAEAVRVAEQSIDARISKNLGIVADRGADEDGIQIVIPAFYADDGHTILLDLVVPGPGPVAEVLAKFKDLVLFKNGTAQANLTLSASPKPMGRLEANVLKNLMAYELSQALLTAGSTLQRSSDSQVALYLFEYYAALLRGLQQMPAVGETDTDVKQDLRMLEGYQQVLRKAPLGQVEIRNLIADSLRVASILKLQPKPQIP